MSDPNKPDQISQIEARLAHYEQSLATIKRLEGEISARDTAAIVNRVRAAAASHGVDPADADDVVKLTVTNFAVDSRGEVLAKDGKTVEQAIGEWVSARPRYATRKGAQPAQRTQTQSPWQPGSSPATHPARPMADPTADPSGFAAQWTDYARRLK